MSTYVIVPPKKEEPAGYLTAEFILALTITGVLSGLVVEFVSRKLMR
jgi:hypothetical protein